MKTLTHNGIHFNKEYNRQVNVEPVPKSYIGARLVWIVAHGRTNERRRDYFFTKAEAIKFTESYKCLEHEWGGDIYVYWMPRENAVLNSRGEIIDVRNK